MRNGAQDLPHDMREQVDAALAREGQSFDDDRTALTALVNLYHGYKNAYEAIAREIGNLRMTAAPYLRPSDHIIPKGPSIFVVTLPKSGTVFIGQSLRQSLGYDFTNTLVTPIFPKNVVWPTMAWDFQRGGMVSVSHMQADSPNIAAIKHGGVTRGILHIRDPRAALNSWLHFLLDKAEERAANNPPGMAPPVFKENFLTLSSEARIERLIDRFFRQAVEWIECWMETLDRDTELDFKVLTHELLAADEEKYFAEIMHFYGLAAKIAPVARSRDTHFRAGNNSEWRQALTPAQIDRVNAMIPEQLWTRFKWAK